METQKQTKGQLGFWRRFTGSWAGFLTALSMFFAGFKFYKIEDWRILLVGAMLCAILLIAGLGKDIAEIAKKKLD